MKHTVPFNILNIQTDEWNNILFTVVFLSYVNTLTGAS